MLDKSRLIYESIPGTIEKIEDASMQNGQHMNSADKHDQYKHLTDEHDQSIISPRDNKNDDYENLQQTKAAQNKTCEQNTNTAAKTKPAKQKISQADLHETVALSFSALCSLILI